VVIFIVSPLLLFLLPLLLLPLLLLLLHNHHHRHYYYQRRRLHRKLDEEREQLAVVMREVECAEDKMMRSSKRVIDIKKARLRGQLRSLPPPPRFDMTRKLKKVRRGWVVGDG